MRKVRLEYVHVRICGPRDNKRDWSEHLVALPVFFQSRLVPQGCKGHVGTIAKKLTIFTGQNLQLLSARYSRYVGSLHTLFCVWLRANYALA